MDSEMREFRFYRSIILILNIVWKPRKYIYIYVKVKPKKAYLVI